MNTITKESIVDTIEGLEQLTNRGIQSVYIDMAIAGLRRLQASLEAEPVAYIIQDKADRKEGNLGQLSFKSVEQYHEKDINEHELTATPLYTAPPAPVAVPDFGALTKCIVQRLVDYGAADDDAIARAEEFVYNACRAAMLQGGKS
ncbi:TPA: hypothetical protein ACYU26_002253 [Enterobacter ludwigii]